MSSCVFKCAFLCYICDKLEIPCLLLYTDRDWILCWNLLSCSWMERKNIAVNYKRVQ